ncbi:MAG: hypothetical protein SangKO_100080 [Sandaracinaceae bacterium]
MTEPEVVYHVLRHIRKHGLHGQDVAKSFVSPDRGTKSFAPLGALEEREGDLFQKIKVTYEGQQDFYPDIIGLLADGETLFAIEAKGKRHHLGGVTQAESYRAGVQSCWFAGPASAFARQPKAGDCAQKADIGVLVVDETGSVEQHRGTSLYHPLASEYNRIRLRFSVLRQISAAQSFSYNSAVHYLAPVLTMRPGFVYTRVELERAVECYPHPAGFRGVLTGAQKLGLIEEASRTLRLTAAGEAVCAIVQGLISLKELGELHVRTLQETQRLLSHDRPDVAGVLQLLLVSDPVVRVIIRALENRRPRPVSEVELAKECEKIDSAVAHVLFITPDHLDDSFGPSGRVEWDRLDGAHFRDTTSNQLKRVLQHAGILAYSELRNDRHPRDVDWELAPRFIGSDLLESTPLGYELYPESRTARRRPRHD